MKKWLTLLLVVLFVTPAFADRPRLRGPSRAKLKKVVIVKKGHHRHVRYNRCCDLYRLRSNSRKLYRVYRQPRKIVVIVQLARKSVPKPKQKPRIAPRSRHKTIFIAPRTQILPYRMKTRNQTIVESKDKVRSRVYNIGERKQ